jgi:hypothetical protein
MRARPLTWGTAPAAAPVIFWATAGKAFHGSTKTSSCDGTLKEVLVALLLSGAFIFVWVIIAVVTITTPLEDHVGLLVLLGLLLVVELSALIGGQSANTSQGCGREGVALDVSTLLFGFTAIVQLLATSKKGSTGDGCNDLLVLGHSFGLGLAILIFVVGAGVPSSVRTAIIITITRIISPAIFVFFFVVVWSSGSSTTDIAGAGWGEFTANLFYRQVAIFTSTRDNLAVSLWGERVSRVEITGIISAFLPHIAARVVPIIRVVVGHKDGVCGFVCCLYVLVMTQW